jgi:uroporphyrinogen-III synthase
VIAIGPTTGQALTDHRRPPDQEAPSPDPSGLASALESAANEPESRSRDRASNA